MARNRAKTKHIGSAYFSKRGWKPHRFQVEAWEAYARGENGLVNAPTGSGKTYSLWMAILQEHAISEKHEKGLIAIWITPIRALAREIQNATERVLEAMDIPWEVGIRTGDTDAKTRARQSRKMPQLLITTPESLHLLLGQKKHDKRFSKLCAVVVDEWHELIGNKRGVQTELALSHLRAMNPKLRTWAISATIGNMEQSAEVFLGPKHGQKKWSWITSDVEKKIEVETIIPDEIETFPWSGHLGVVLLEKVIPIIEESKSCLIFTNTRAQTEIWYQKILEVAPEFAGQIAMHHGSISRELRSWVEEALHEEKLKAVVCTSSLDLGVDFRPVETIIQVGGPKGVARFVQRAGRSGHKPGAVSRIFFVPTNSLELIEGAALRQAIQDQFLEQRIPYIRSFDVLIQYLVTLAIGDGFYPDDIFREVKETHAFESITQEEWNWLLSFIRYGGQTLKGYDEYHKVEVDENGLWKVTRRRIALQHRLNIGTIVSDASLSVKFQRGGRVGTIEEWFVSQLKPGDTFWFAGRSLELIRVRGMEVTVKLSKQKKGKVPAWMGGRMPLSSQMSEMIRMKMDEAITENYRDPETRVIAPLIQSQKQRSAVPQKGEWLLEYIQTREGYHLYIYPFEGRMVHEALAGLLAYRLSLIEPMTFSLAYSDYGFELLSDKTIPYEAIFEQNLLSTRYLSQDLQASVNAAEMARRKFRDIAVISGLIFQGYPGKPVKTKHLQSSSQLIFDVFRDYEPDNLLYQQAIDEVYTFQFEMERLVDTLERLQREEALICEPEKPTPFAFHILVDRLRQRLTSESLEDRIKRMQQQWAME